mmetsp:Transcript_20277/g.48054  ORF Transcript_20277/g.48054 Transcript_20277/m.48054 type:complete len:361 (-) Transcript_20277:700-1782(-)
MPKYAKAVVKNRPENLVHQLLLGDFVDLVVVKPQNGLLAITAGVQGLHAQDEAKVDLEEPAAPGEHDVASMAVSKTQDKGHDGRYRRRECQDLSSLWQARGLILGDQVFQEALGARGLPRVCGPLGQVLFAYRVWDHLHQVVAGCDRHHRVRDLHISSLEVLLAPDLPDLWVCVDQEVHELQGPSGGTLLWRSVVTFGDHLDLLLRAFTISALELQDARAVGARGRGCLLPGGDGGAEASGKRHILELLPLEVLDLSGPVDEVPKSAQAIKPLLKRRLHLIHQLVLPALEGYVLLPGPERQLQAQGHAGHRLGPLIQPFLELLVKMAVRVVMVEQLLQLKLQLLLRPTVPEPQRRLQQPL